VKDAMTAFPEETHHLRKRDETYDSLKLLDERCIIFNDRGKRRKLQNEKKSKIITTLLKTVQFHHHYNLLRR
jgi:hypothetical protein